MLVGVVVGCLAVLVCAGCDPIDTTEIDGCSIQLRGVNTHDSPGWVTARVAGCAGFKWATLKMHSRPYDETFPLGAPGKVSQLVPGCMMWTWPQSVQGEWRVLGLVNGIAELELSSDDIAFSDGVLPAYQWPGQDWTTVLFGGPECPGPDGPTFPNMPTPEVPTENVLAF